MTYSTVSRPAAVVGGFQLKSFHQNRPNLTVIGIKILLEMERRDQKKYWAEILDITPTVCFGTHLVYCELPYSLKDFFLVLKVWRG
jgi:hypothetical protein